MMLLVILVSAGNALLGADYVDITTELNSTWRSHTKTNHLSVTARSVVGSKDWHISGDFMTNARIDYWLVGTNLVEHETITSSMYLERIKDFVSEDILRQRRLSPIVSHSHSGETFTTVHRSPIGQPVFHGMEGVLWLAFCSGNYLRQDGRQIPMPIGPSSHGFGYSDKTLVFDDDLGLPKSVQLYAKDGQLACKYEVLETTNCFGHIFPLKFRVVQQGQPADGQARLSSTTELLGHVISIKAGEEPKLPNQVREKLGL